MKPSTFLKFFLVALPLLEIAVFIWVGSLIGIAWTILLVIGSSFLGILLVRSQGFNMMNQFARNARAGRAEPSELMNGSFIFIGGFLLIIPGFITDIIGLLCLIPIIRHTVVKWLILAIAQRQPTTPTHQHHQVIEGKFTQTHHKRDES